MRNLLREFEVEKPKLLGFYRAKVEDNNDPRKLGRVQVRVYPHFETMARQDLPWAEPCWWMPMQIPPRESWVWVFFEGGDPLYPVYLGQSLPYGVNEKLKTEEGADNARYQHMLPKIWFQEIGADYPEAWIIRTPRRHLVVVEEGGPIRIHHEDGTKITLEEGGEVWIHHKTGSHLRMKDDGDVILWAKRDLWLKAGRHIRTKKGKKPDEPEKWYE